MNTSQHVGFIGHGDQGAPMARAIAQKHVLHVWARRPEAYEVLSGVRRDRMTSSHRTKAPRHPPTKVVGLHAWAPERPPLTGASRNPTANSSHISSSRSAFEGWPVAWLIRILPPPTMP